MPKCDFNKVAKQLYPITLRHGCSPVNVLHIFKALFIKNNSGWLLLLPWTLAHYRLPLSEMFDLFTQ